MVLLHLWVGQILYVHYENLEGPSQLLPPFKSEHLEWVRTSWPAPISPKCKLLYSYMVVWKYLVHSDIPTMIRLIINGKVQQKLSARKVTHQSTIPALGPLHTQDWGSNGVKCVQDGCKVYTDSYMASNGSCFTVVWIIFKNYLLEVGLTQNWESMILQISQPLIYWHCL